MYFKGELPFLVGPNFGDRTISTEKTIDENVSTWLLMFSFKLQIV